jgi:hypothetical protein
MNKEQVIDGVYRKYADSHEYFVDGWMHVIPMEHSKETFINKCKTNPEFSEKWGLKIEERELSEKERIIFAGYDYENGGGIGWNMIRETVDMDNSIPRKLITLTYNNETIESYE